MVVIKAVFYNIPGFSSALNVISNAEISKGSRIRKIIEIFSCLEVLNADCVCNIFFKKT